MRPLRASGSMRQGLVFLVMGMQRGYPRQTHIRGIRKILVAFQPNRHANFGFRRNRRTVTGRGSGPQHTQNASAAAYRHALAQGDFRRHSQRDLDFGAFGKRRISNKKHSARTQVLRESNAFNRSGRLAKRERKQINRCPTRRSTRTGEVVMASLPLAKRRKTQKRYFSAD